MKIVVDINDEDYKRIQDIPDVCNSLTSRAYSAIRCGRPLPDHHGRLIDADALMENCLYFETELDLEKTPTIIEGE